MASIQQLHATSLKNPGGFAGTRTDTCAVFVATGKAATDRGHEGKVVVSAEWYRPESMSDDDLSTGGWLLKSRSGQSRVSKTIVVEDASLGAAKLRAIVPRIVGEAIED